VSAKLKLQPFSAPLSGTKAIAFTVSNLDSSKSYRIEIENATFNRTLKPNTLTNGFVSGNHVYVEGTAIVSGRVDLGLTEADSASVISVYANVEEKTDSGVWRLSDIAAFSFQIESSVPKGTGDKISVYPPFVGLQEKATIKVHSKPNSSLRVSVNSKNFVVKTNYSGEGSISFRAIDVISGSSLSSKTLLKFPVLYSMPNDKSGQIFDSGSYVHFVPEEMKALQATSDPAAPECAILDPIPGEGLTLRKLDDFCVDGAVVGDMSIFDEESTFHNSKAGFCSDLNEVYPVSNEAVCRIFNSTSSALLHDGSGLVVFSSQETFENSPDVMPTLSSRVFIASLPSSLKYKGNPVRDGSILNPPRFYHTVTPSNISANEKYGIIFRVDDGTVFEIQYTTILGTVAEIISAFVTLVNNDLSARSYNIKAVDQSTFIELKSDDRFTIRTDVISGDGTFEAALKSNRTLDVLVDSSAIYDQGNTLVFLSPQVGYQSHEIVSRDYVNNVIRINVPNGFNNDVGPNIFETIYCQKFVVVDSDTELPSASLTDVNPLPYVYDIYNREVSCVYPVVAVRKIEATGEEIAYVVCQAPVDGIYQLFYYSFRVGQSIENTQWKQLTQVGENKNAKIKCDKDGNLHIVWESDRLGPTQLYYSILGQCSRAITNQIAMSILDKNALSDANVDLYSIQTPGSPIQTGFTRVLGNNGKASVYSSTFVAVTGNPSQDTAMAYTTISKDEYGNDFPAGFSQLSYQVSFSLWMPKLATGILTDEDIEERFNQWKSTFTPVGNYTYLRTKNVYTIDKYERFYENSIPICGAFKLDSQNIATKVGGDVYSGVEHNYPLIYGEYTQSPTLTHESNIRHWMLLLVPEKIRFRAKNTETYSQFCQRNSQDDGDCSGFNNEIEYEIGTGRYKLALILSTSANDSDERSAYKTHIIYRLLDGYVDFAELKNLKVAVHYSKMGSDHIDSVLKRRKETTAEKDKYRYNADIIVSYGNDIVAATSFLADFTDQYRKFDIVLGMPPGNGFKINEIIPFKGNMYENGDFYQKFYDINIGPHSITLNSDYFDFSSFDRDTSQMVVHDIDRNILSNGGFEDTVLPYADHTRLEDGYTSIDGWTVYRGVSYRRVSSYTPPSTVGLSPSIGRSWVEVNGQLVGNVAYKGAIYTNVATEVGTSYSVTFDSSNNPNNYTQGSVVTKRVRVIAGPTTKLFTTTLEATGPTPTNWRTVSFKFVANSTSTLLRFENASNFFNDPKDFSSGPQIDNVVVVPEESLNDEFSSFTTAESLLVDQQEFDLNYSLNATDNFTQIPITVSDTYQNKNPDLFIDKKNKFHVVWQSNRDGYWNIFYGGARVRGVPFRFDSQITDSGSNSVNPSIAVDGFGRRVIVWQDDRNGNSSIYSAVSKVVDDEFSDMCKQDEIDEFIYRWNSAIDPYFDPYTANITQLNCEIGFSFSAPSTNPFHFSLWLYEDKEYTTLYKKISSSESIGGWRVDNVQLAYNGLSAVEDTVYQVTYTPSYEDDISGRVLYVIVEYEISSTIVDIVNSSNVRTIFAYDGLNLKSNRFENTENVTAIFESEMRSPIAVDPQDLSDINYQLFSGVSFEYPLTELPGVEVDQKIRSVLLHYDPAGASGNVNAVVRFNSPILAVFVSSSKLIATNTVFGHSGVTYHTTDSTAGIENLDTLVISADRKTITMDFDVNPAMDEIRVILLDDSASVGESNFVYYCPSKQSARCDVRCSFSNNSIVDKTVHFRVSFYSNPEKTDLIMSSFTQTDTLNWFFSSSDFPPEGLTVQPGQSIGVVYSPEILPFEMREAQTVTDYSETLFRQPLICGVPYRVVVESYRDGSFYVESEFELLCPCARTDADFVSRDKDLDNWVSSGRGFDDIRVTITDHECLFPKVVVSENDLFYVIWQDFRYSRILENQQFVSPDYFMALYDANADKFVCSGQGEYDRRLTSFANNGKVLYDASIFLDPFQNINLVLHDGQKVYSQICSLGCVYEAKNRDLILPCMFTDETDPSFFVVGGSPDRAVDQYQKIRIRPSSISYSTYLDLQTPIPVITDCFIELDIIGIPGAYAYRLKNETDEDWTEWLPIGPDLPAQTQTDTDGTKSERDFFRAYFTQKDRFVAPWVTSPENGVKKVCCEVLTFFGKSESFCVDFMAIYNSLEYKIDLFFDEELTQPVPLYKSYPVVSANKTTTYIDDTNLTSIQEETSSVSTIWAKIEFRDKKKLSVLEQLRAIDRFGLSSNITMNVYQQGINDQIGIVVTKVSEGIYKGSFSVLEDDGVINIDGLGIITVDVPGQCNPETFSELSTRATMMESNNSIDQKISIFNNFTVFREKYNESDMKGSFGNPDYYKIRTFGASPVSSGSWVGGGNGPIKGDIGYEPSNGSGNGEIGGGSGGSGNGGGSDSGSNGGSNGSGSNTNG